MPLFLTPSQNLSQWLVALVLCSCTLFFKLSSVFQIFCLFVLCVACFSPETPSCHQSQYWIAGSGFICELRSPYSMCTPREREITCYKQKLLRSGKQSLCPKHTEVSILHQDSLLEKHFMHLRKTTFFLLALFNSLWKSLTVTDCSAE